MNHCEKPIDRNRRRESCHHLHFQVKKIQSQGLELRTEGTISGNSKVQPDLERASILEI